MWARDHTLLEAGAGWSCQGRPGLVPGREDKGHQGDASRTPESDSSKIQDGLITDVGKHMSKATVPNLAPSNAQEVPESLRRMGGCRGKGDSPLETKRYVDNQYRHG